MFKDIKYKSASYTYNDKVFMVKAYLITESNLKSLSKYTLAHDDKIKLDPSLIGLYLVEHLYHTSFSIEQNLKNYTVSSDQVGEIAQSKIGKLRHLASKSEFHFLHYNSFDVYPEIKKFIMNAGYFIDESELMLHGERPVLILESSEDIEVSDCLDLGEYIICNLDNNEIDVIRNLNEFEVIA